MKSFKTAFNRTYDMQICCTLGYRLQDPKRCSPFHRIVGRDWCILVIDSLILCHKSQNIRTIWTMPCNFHQLLLNKSNQLDHISVN